MATVRIIALLIPSVQEQLHEPVVPAQVLQTVLSQIYMPQWGYLGILVLFFPKEVTLVINDGCYGTSETDESHLYLRIVLLALGSSISPHSRVLGTQYSFYNPI